MEIRHQSCSLLLSVDNMNLEGMTQWFEVQRQRLSQKEMEEG